MFNPPKYTLTARTATEALDALIACEQLIQAHLTAREPDTRKRRRIARETPTPLTITLDLGLLTEQINHPSPTTEA